jgi:hypothetical protein
MSAHPIEIREGSDAHQALLRFAFAQIQNPDDWKGPIDCIVPFAAAATYVEAITFMTGVAPTSERSGYNSFRLKCVGYSAGPCGDH